MIVGRGMHVRIATFDLSQAVGLQVADCDNLRAGSFGKIAGQVRPPITIADQPHANHRLPPPAETRMEDRGLRIERRRPSILYLPSSILILTRPTAVPES